LSLADSQGESVLLLAIFICLVVLGLVAVVGRTYQYLGTRRDLRWHPAPGKLVDVGTHRLHLLSIGEGSPTVVFESGLMSTVMTWQGMQPEIAKRTRTVCYDRAGLGWSEPGPLPRDANRIVEELHRLLEKAAIPPPYILVGHSFGGLTVRLFASRNANEVAGLVLIDPVVLDEWYPATEHNEKRMRTGVRILWRATGLSRWGALRFVSWLLRAGIKPLAEPLVRMMSKGAPQGDGTTRSPLFWNLPASEREMAGVFWVQPKFTETIASQLENLPESAVQVAREDGGLAGKPVVVISAANTPAGRREEQAATARLSEMGRHMTAGKSGHWVMVDEPGLVVQAIVDVIEETRSAQRMAASG
jgi:pimeloyl-ACP methyl ester carboxylesterase